MEINIIVHDKIASGDGTWIVCGNSDYIVRFTLDSEWDQFITRTMIVVNADKTYQEVVFTGDTATLPVINNQKSVSIGLYAGDLHTTTSAYFNCKKSARDGLGAHEEPSKDVYNQLVQLVENGAVKGDKGDKTYLHIAYANSEDGETDFTTSPVVDKVYTYLGSYSDYTPEDSNVPSTYVWSKLTEEAERAAAELLRVAAENARVLAEQGRVTDTQEAISRVNTAASNAQNVADTVQSKLDAGDFVGPQGVQGIPGPKGDDGYSPTASVSKEGTTTTISITDKTGTTRATVEDGAKGDKGDPGSDASVTAENIQSALGYVPVKDVQVAGTSVMTDGVANVPIASGTGAGVVSILNPVDSGIWNDNGSLKVSFATDAEISTRLGFRKTIVCANLDNAVKAAMCDGKGAAWTSDEQAAARSRMGVDKPYELIEEITLAEESTVARSTEPDGTPYNFAVVMLRVEFPASEKTDNIPIIYRIGGIRSNEIISYFISPYRADGVKYGYSKVWVENGRYCSGWWTCVKSHGQFAGYYENPMIQDKYSTADGNITSFNTSSVVAAGTKIMIYGVRA